MEPLADRLAVWAIDNGGRLEIFWEPSGARGGSVAARVGIDVGHGRTVNQALNALADELAEGGWDDDRDPGA